MLEWATLALVVATYRAPRRALAALGLSADRRALAIGASVALAFGVLAWVGAGGPQEFLARVPRGAQLFIPPSELDARLLWLAMSVTAAICEEVLWRGVMLRELERWTGSLPAAAVLSALMLAYFHGGFDQGAFAFAWRTVVALGLTWLAVGTRSLRWPILVHFLADASALAAIQVA